jgi:hypothetical protein
VSLVHGDFAQSWKLSGGEVSSPDSGLCKSDLTLLLVTMLYASESCTDKASSSSSSEK